MLKKLTLFGGPLRVLWALVWGSPYHQSPVAPTERGKYQHSAASKKLHIYFNDCSPLETGVARKEKFHIILEPKEFGQAGEQTEASA